jgi:hypothetical protein
VSGCLDELYNLVSEDFTAQHFITIAFALNAEEINYLTEGVKRLPVKEGGRVHLMFNVMWPLVSDHTNTAQCLIVNFRGGQGVSHFLKEFLAEKESLTPANGIDWAELSEIAERVPEGTISENIEEELKRILKVVHL